MAALRLHDYAASGNCYKVRLLLAQLGREYERVPVDIFAGETLTDAFVRLSPLRMTPVLELEDGRCLTESAAILFYLAQGTPFWPMDPFEQGQVVRWLVYEQSDVMPAVAGLRFRLLTGRLRPGDPDAVRRREIGREALGLLDQTLGETTFLAGESYSIADIAVYGYVHVADDAGFVFADFPRLSRWLGAVAAQPGYMNDFEPYPENAWPGVGRSIYD